MHREAAAWIARWVPDRPVVVLEVGGRNINGGVRHMFQVAAWTSVDLVPGVGVDVVADFCDYEHPDPVDVVVCCEVAEHCQDWPTLVWNAAHHLGPDGLFLFTAAGPGRVPHSAEDGGEVRAGEFYENVDPDRLKSILRPLFHRFEVDVLGPDVRAVAWR